MLLRIANRLEEGAIAFLLAAMTLLSFVQVILRYVFNSGLSWALEASTYLFAWLVLIGISYGVKVGAHIGVQALVDMLPPRVKRFVSLIAGGLCIVYAVLLTIGSWKYFQTVKMIGVTGEDINIQRWILLLVLPFGFAMLIVRLAQATWSIALGKEVGFKLHDEAADAMKNLRNDDQAAEGPDARPNSEHDK
ncbi:MAG: TRAP transporter small permease [Flavobacteriaceae bacterium]